MTPGPGTSTRKAPSNREARPGLLRRHFEKHPWIPYAAPFALFIVLTALQGADPAITTWMYPLKTILVGVLLLYVLRDLPPLEPRATGLALGVGLLVFVVWVVPEGRYPLLADPEPFDPRTHLVTPWLYGWIAFRLIGASVVVPVIEEYFWRGFILRWLVKADFRKVAIGTFTWPSFLISSVLFASEHNRWLVGLAAGVAYNLLLYRTKSLYACVIAHAVTNLVLGVYVLVTGQWPFW